MAFKVILAKRANADLNEIIVFYDEQSKAATQSFLREFIAALDMVAEQPKACQLAFANIRKLVLAKFPFNVFYTIKERKQEIVVARILAPKA